MAVKHPCPRVIRDKFHIARLSHAHQYRVSGVPGRLRDTTAFRACYIKSMAVKVDRVVIHSEIDHSDTNAVAQPHNEWSRSWTGLSIKEQPIEFHVHGVRNSIVR